MWVIIKCDNTIEGPMHQDRDAFKIMRLTIEHGLNNVFYTDDLDEAHRKELQWIQGIYNDTLVEYRQLCESF